jgi:hypothetical protein
MIIHRLKAEKAKKATHTLKRQVVIRRFKTQQEMTATHRLENQKQVALVVLK